MTTLNINDRARRPLLSSEVAELYPGSTCPVCSSRQLLIRQITSRLQGGVIYMKQVYCPICGSTGQHELPAPGNRAPGF
jgi:DNA-directed RNA polymerase subunit RPC12/RpoP